MLKEMDLLYLRGIETPLPPCSEPQTAHRLDDNKI